MQFSNLLRKKAENNRTLINEDYLEKIHNGHDIDDQFQIICKDGLYKWVNIKTKVLLCNEDKSSYYLFFFNDISKEKFLEKKLKKVKSKYKYLNEQMNIIFDNIPALIFYKDINNNIVKVNQYTATEYGLRKEELEGESCFKLYSNQIANNYWLDDLEVIKNQKAKLRYEEQWTTKMGSKWLETSKIPYIDTNGIVKGIIGFSIDISKYKKKEDQLKESKKKYRRIIETIKDGYYEINLHSRYTYVNDALCEMLGYTKLEMFKLRLSDQFDENTKNFLYNSFQKLYEQENNDMTVHYYFTKKDGTVLYLKTSAYMKYDNNKHKIGFYGLVKDITRNKILENYIEQLKKSEEKYRIFIENINEGYYEIDKEGKFLYVNDALCKILEYPISEIYLLRMGEICDEKTGLSIFHSFNECCEKEKNESNIQFEFQKKNGEKIFLEISVFLRHDIEGNKIGFYGLVRDITRNKILEHLNEEIHNSEIKYRNIVENIKEGYYEVDIKGHYTFINPAFCKIVERSAEDLIGLSYKKLMKEDVAEFVFKGFNEVFNTGVPKYDFEFAFTCKNDKKIIVESSVDIKYDNERNKIGFFGLVRDKTIRKIEETIMEEMNEYLEIIVEQRTKELNDLLKEQKNYLNEIIKASQFKSQFMAMMSHELRTPLNAIMGFTDLLLEESLGPISDLQKEYISDIKSSSKHQFNMVQNILDISRIEAGEINLVLKDFPVNNIINQVISSFKLQIDEKKLEIIKEGFNRECIIYADPVKFKQIYMNIFDNAVKYTKEGNITLSFEENVREWIFKIKDTGIGIAKKDYNLIFEDFKRCDESPYVKSIYGTGLGLPLAKRIINLHGGEITFFSNIGKGTTFTFSIPKKQIKSVV